MKQAWLVIAHNEFEILQMLIDALDHPESDIYVHIDKKVKNIPRLRAGKSNLYVLERRLDVRWGSVSQIECELLLMSEAVRRGPYLFYHVISGTHLPLKNIDDIIQFFSDRAGSELMHLWEEDLRDIGNKLSRYNFFVRGSQIFTNKRFIPGRFIDLSIKGLYCSHRLMDAFSMIE